MVRRLLLILLLLLSVSGWSQTWRQAVGANDAQTVSFSPTLSGSVDVVLAFVYPRSGVTVIDSKSQSYTLDACTGGTSGTIYGDSYTCVWYACGGTAGVTSATVTAAEGGTVLATEFFEGTGVIATSNCAGAVNAATNSAAPATISLTPDETSELGLVGFACAGAANGMTGNVTYSNQLDDAANPVATTVFTSTSTATASVAADCIPSDDENPNGWNAVYAAFRTKQPATSCPSSVPVPAMAGCAYNANLGSEAVASTSAAQAVNVTVAGGTTVGSIAVFTTGIASKDFANASGSTCTATTYASATNCVVDVTLTPLAPGLRRGAVVFYSGAGNTGTVLATVPIYGIGTSPQVAYGPSGAQSNVGSGFSTPEGVAVDGAGNVFVADPGVPAVYKITTGGTQTTVGSGFVKPESVAVDGAGNVYVADFGAAAVYMVAPGGTPTAVGSGFGSPTGVAVDGLGDVFVADAGNAAVYEITPAGTQTKVGSGYVKPEAVAVDGSGDVFVADAGAPAVYEVTGGTPTAVGSGFSEPEGVAVDAAGDVYVVDAGAGAVYKVTPGGVQSTISSGFSGPDGVAVNGSGNLYVGNTGKSLVVKIDRADAPSLSFATTTMSSTSTDSPRTVQVENIGNTALTLTALSYPTDFPEATGDSSACTSTTSLNPALQCDLPIDFTPQSAATLNEDVTITDNNLNGTAVKQSIAVSGTGTNAGPAVLTSPTPKSTLAGPSATFVWTASQSGSTYDLLLGTTGVGSNNLWGSGSTTVTSITFGGLPTNGQTVYVRLFTTTSGVTVHSDYTYTAASQAVLTSPTPGSTLTGISATFMWTASAGATSYDIWLGSTGVGSNNLWGSGTTTATSVTFGGLPANGETIYVRLFTTLSGVTVHSDYTYTAVSQAVLTSPAPGSTLAGTSVAFSWAAVNGATSYDLYLGSTGVGSNNLWNSGATTATSVTAGALPTNGETVYARLFTTLGGVTEHNDYTYTATSPAVLTSPTPGSTFASTSATFSWAAVSGAASYDLLLGSTGVGSNNIWGSGATTSTSITFNALPTNGETVYVRLITTWGGVTAHNDYMYTAVSQSVLTSPTPGSTLAGPSATFMWTSVTGASSYDIWLGSTGAGSNNIWGSGSTTATSVTFGALPTNGETVYVRLFTTLNGVTVHNDYTYTAASQGVLKSPLPGSTLSGMSQSFTWTAGSGATSYTLLLGTTGVGSDNLGSSGATTATSATFNNLPTNGGTVYARLFTTLNGTMVHTDYSYTAQ